MLITALPELRHRIADGIAWVELNRPARGNALSSDLVEQLIHAVGISVADPSVHTMALCGAGRHFCTGFDLDQLERASDGDLLQRFVRIEALLDSLWRAPVRTIAMANGLAIGAGADLFAACDHRVLAPDSRLRFPGAGFGIVLGTRRLAARVGRERALSWVSGGCMIDAPLALASGLASTLASTSPPSEAPEQSFDSPLFHWRMAQLPPPPSVDRATLAALKAAAWPAGPADAVASSDADLAALVRSASAPGLRDRIAAYRDRNTRG